MFLRKGRKWLHVSYSLLVSTLYNIPSFLIVTMDHVGLLLHKLREVQYEAKDFGIKLGLKNSDIEAIYKQSHKTPRECLQQVFSLWLKQPSKHRTWAVLLQALRRDGEQVIANTIERRYTLDQSGMIDLLSVYKYIISSLI